jgi:hypothetical protein
MVSLAEGFDARCLSPGQAGLFVGLCAQIEASAASIKALAAARSAESNDWQLAGFRSAADQLAHEAGMSPGAARRALETGKRMAEQPEVAAAALAGHLSLEQAGAVSDGVAADPTRAEELIGKAKRVSLPELNEEVARIKAARTDQEQRWQQIQARRSLRRWTDRDGALQSRLYGHPEGGALLWQMLDPVRRRLIMLRREAGSANESLDALDYDALMTVASIAVGKSAELGLAELVDLGLFPDAAGLTAPPDSSPGPPAGGAPVPAIPSKGRPGKKLAGSPARVMVRVDFDALFRGVALDGELCEIAGYGPVPVWVVKELIATQNPFIIGILTKTHQLAGVYHHGRHPNAHQRSALDFLYPTCAVEGCSATAGLQYDHRQDYVKTEITAFDLLDRLCRHHHDKKTYQGWALVDGTGKRAFVPPGHPRHPR